MWFVDETWQVYLIFFYNDCEVDQSMLEIACDVMCDRNRSGSICTHFFRNSGTLLQDPWRSSADFRNFAPISMKEFHIFSSHWGLQALQSASQELVHLQELCGYIKALVAERPTSRRWTRGARFAKALSEFNKQYNLCFHQYVARSWPGTSSFSKDNYVQKYVAPTPATLTRRSGGGGAEEEAAIAVSTGEEEQ